MKKLVKNILFVSAILLSTQAFCAVDEVLVERHYDGGKVGRETVKLQKVDKNTYRLHIPVDTFSKRKHWIKWEDIDHIDIKHSEALANTGDKGYWVLADGRLGSFKAQSGILEERRHPMPLFGFKRGEQAFVGIVKGLKYEFSVVVDVKDSKYQMFPRFKIRDLHTKPYEDIIIDFTFFKGKKANYSSMAREYRKYQLERGEVKPLKERVVGNPALKQTVDSMFVKFCTAWYMRDSDLKSNRGDHWYPEDDPALSTFCTFEEFKGVMKKIKSLGVDKLDICLTNWNLRANGRNPTGYLAEPELGGNAKLKEVTALAKELGFQIAPHILHTEYYTISDEFDANDIAVDHKGKHKGYAGMGGKGFNPCFKQVYHKYVLPSYDTMAKLGFNLMHIDVTSAIVPYDCHHIEHFSTRQETAEYMNKVGMLSDTFFNVWSSECGMDQVANTMDYALYISGYPHYLGRKHFLMDTMVPIWQIAYHGIILSNPFIHTIDYNCHWQKSKSSIANNRLKMVEFGGRPSYYWAINKNCDFGVLKEAYDEYEKRKHLQYEFMEYHGKLADNVFITRYSDKTRIICNYGKDPYIYKGIEVKPMDYIIYNSKKQK